MSTLADALARTRLRPPRWRAALVERPALAARLDAALRSARLVVLSAPAGYGKTALLSQAVQRLDAAVAWVSVDGDDDLPRLLVALFAALDPMDLPWRVDPEALVQAARQGQPQLALAALVNALDAAGVVHGVVVLDDLHRLVDAAAAAWLAAFVERLPAGWTLVLSGRQDPPLALARWQAAGELALFRQEALRFDEQALTALGRELGVTPERAQPLLARTGGWPAGVRLGLIALQGTTAAAGPSGDAPPDPTPLEPALFDYLATEVLAQLPPALQQFLRRCAVLPLWSPRRCAAVSGDAEAARWLDEIERRALFVAQIQDDASDERVLAPHDLLRDCLLHLLQRHEPEMLPLLLQRAAAVEPDVLRRVALLQRAGAWDAAEQALADLGPEAVGGAGQATLRKLLDAFPAPQRTGSPRLQWLRGLAAWTDWHWSEMLDALQRTQALAQAAGDPQLARRAAAHLALAANALEIEPLTGPAVLTPLLNDADAEVRLCAFVAQTWWDYDHTRLSAVAPHFAAMLAALQPIDSARLWYQTAPPPGFSTLPGMQPLLRRWGQGALQRSGDRAGALRAVAQGWRAWSAMWAGEVAEAEAALAEAEADSRWIGDPPTVVVPLQMARLLLAAWRGDGATVRDGVEGLLSRVVDAAAGDRPRLWQHLFAHYGLRVAGAAGETELLLRCADRAETVQVASRRPIYHAQHGALAAHRAGAEGRWADAARLWRDALAAPEPLDLLAQACEGRLRLAHALLRSAGLQGGAEAAAAVAEALAQAEAEGQPARLWMAGLEVLQALAAADWGVDAGAPGTATLGPRLRDACAALQALRRPPAVAARARRDEGEVAVGAAVAAAGLSARELEVLARVAAGDSNKLIARALDLSPHTVKRHVANILDKLALATRGQAAAWWRQHADRA